MARPTAQDPMVGVGLRIPKSWMAELEAARVRRGLSRQEFVRRALRRVLDAEARQP